MKARIATLLACISVAIAAVCALGLGGCAALAEGGAAGHMFPLEFQPLPIKDLRGLRSTAGYFLEPIDEIPDGVEAVKAMSNEAALRQGWRPPPRGLPLFARCRMVLVRSNDKQEGFDRLYVDADPDGRFGPGECHSLSRTEAPRLMIFRDTDGGQMTFREVGECRVKVVVGSKTGGTSIWVHVRVSLGQDRAYVSFTDVTCAMGKVRLADRDIRFALYYRDLARSPDRLGRAVELPDPSARGARRRIQTGCQVLFDINGNGVFDDLDLAGIGPENRWLTRLIRFHGKYYELAVGLGGRSVRITPSKTKVGTLKIPDGVASASLVGPAFATRVTNEDRQIELPVGRYVVMAYLCQTDAGLLRARDVRADAVTEIKPGQITRLELGAPLGMTVTQSRLGGDHIRLGLKVLDRAGRQVTNVQTSGKQRPPAPRFKIVDAAGKVVLSHAFKYG